MTLYYTSPENTIYCFDKPLNYEDSVFISGSYEQEVADKGEVIKVLIAASCFVDGAEWRIKQKNGNIVYYQGTFELVQPESETL
jgi:hypothetical protein